MPDSSAPTVTICTPVAISGSGAGSGFGAGGACARRFGGARSRGLRSSRGCADRTRAACARRNCSSARPSPRPARRCASAVPTDERGFSSGATIFSTSVCERRTRLSRALERRRRCTARNAALNRARRTSPSACAIRTSAAPAGAPGADLRALSGARHRPFAGTAAVAGIPGSAAPVAAFLHGHRLISVCSPFQVTAIRSPFMASVIGWRVSAPPLEQRPSM